MATWTTRDTVTRGREYVLPAEWPQGAAIGELRKMMYAAERELEEVFGDKSGNDDVAWVIPGDDEIVIRYEKPKPSEFRTGRCGRCGDPAEYVVTATNEKVCAVHAARAAAGGSNIHEIGTTAGCGR